MTIHGFQKMTLLDYPGKVACTIFTAGCNFRCPFCHNASLVTNLRSDSVYDEEDILAFLKTRRTLLDGVAITGGEPLLQPDIEAFIGRIKDLGFPVKLDTNGSLPERLEAMIDAGLVDYVAMDIKNSKEKYAATAGIPEDLLPKIEQSVKVLLRGRVDYEFRTTVVDELHTVSDIEQIGRWISGAEKYFIQPFRDSGELVGSAPMTSPSKDALKQMESAARPFVPAVSIRGE